MKKSFNLKASLVVAALLSLSVAQVATISKDQYKADYSGKAADQTKVLMAKAKSAYAVAKEKCDDQAGNAKDMCVKEAKAIEVKALADAKAKFGKNGPLR